MALPTVEQLMAQYKKSGPLTAQEIDGMQPTTSPPAQNAQTTPPVPTNVGAMPSISQVGLTPEQYQNIQASQQSLQNLQQLQSQGYGGYNINQLQPGKTIQQIPQLAQGGQVAQPTTPTGTDNELLKQLLESMKPTSRETDLQSQIDTLASQQEGVIASRDLGIQGVGDQPIATPFITGQQTAITNRAATQVGALGAQLNPLQREMALKQAK